MNKAVASFLFTGETLFNLKDENVEPAIKEAVKVENKQAEPVKKKAIVNQNLLVVEFLTVEYKELLDKILASVKVESKDVEIIEQKNFSEYDFSDLKLCKRAISFGDFPELNELFQTTDKYKIKVNHQKQILVVDTLNLISENRNNEKRTLWESLKEMFI